MAKRTAVAIIVGMTLLVASCGGKQYVTSTSTPSAKATSAIAQSEGAAPPLAEQVAKQFALTKLPRVTAVRTVSQDELSGVMNQCIVGKGFPGMTGDVPADQTTSWHLAIYECAAMYPINPRYQQPFSKQQLDVLYTYYEGTLVPCLLSRGLSPAHPPSHATFISAVGTSAMYSPYNSVLGELARMSEEKRNALEKACPEGAPDKLMFPTS